MRVGRLLRSKLVTFPTPWRGAPARAYDGAVNPRLRPMTAADIEPAVAAILADDWGDRRAWFEFAVAHPECRAFVAADDDGAIIGTGVVTINGPVAWIGTIWVAPSVRGRGLGRALTEAPIEEAVAAGCQTLVLVATDAGQPLYERLGFSVRSWYRTMEAPGLAAPIGNDGERGVRAFRPDDLEAMAALDREATGEDRRHLLAAFARTGHDEGRDPSPRSTDRFRHPGAVGWRSDDRPPCRRCARDPAGPSALGGTRAPRPCRDPPRERGRRRRARCRRLDGGLARSTPGPRSTPGMASRTHLGAVQPRARLTAGAGIRSVQHACWPKSPVGGGRTDGEWSGRPL